MPSEQEVRMLCSYDWVGNIRELSSVIERAAILGNGRRLEVAKALGAGTEAVPAESASSLRGSSVERAEQGGLTTLDEQMRLHIEAALRKSFGRVDGPFGATLRLGLHPQTLRSRMRKLGIAVAGFRQRVRHG
jgi:transcriptional regulator with GAF, ATPase, and Fis domain